MVIISKYKGTSPLVPLDVILVFVNNDMTDIFCPLCKVERVVRIKA